jgi:hypothetical protein
VGFVFLLIKRKLRAADGAIFLSGAAYSVLGLAISSLGLRAVAIFIIPISLGVVYLVQTKLKPYLIGLFLIMLILFVAVPLHSSFTSFPIKFQTKDELTTSNFMIDKYDWNSKSTIIADNGASWFISTQIQGNNQVDSDLASHLGLAHITNYDCIIYSVGLANTLQSSGISIENNSQEILQKFSVVYNSGSSYIATKGR